MSHPKTRGDGTLIHQSQFLLQLFPEDPQAQLLMREAIVPAFIEFAQDLQERVYYIPTGPQGEWVITTFSRYDDPLEQMRVLQAFPSAKAAKRAATDATLRRHLTKIPVLPLLWSLYACTEGMEGIVFPEEKKKITHVMLEKLVNLRVQARFPGQAFPSYTPSVWV